MIGLFEGKDAAWNTNTIPDHFSFGEISSDWEKMMPFWKGDDTGADLHGGGCQEFRPRDGGGGSRTAKLFGRGRPQLNRNSHGRRRRKAACPLDRRRQTPHGRHRYQHALPQLRDEDCAACQENAAVRSPVSTRCFLPFLVGRGVCGLVRRRGGSRRGEAQLWSQILVSVLGKRAHCVPRRSRCDGNFWLLQQIQRIGT